MNNFDIGMIITFIILILVTIYLVIIKNYNDKINNKVKKMLEEPFIVADAQDFQNYDKLRLEVKKLPDNFNEDIIKNPPSDKIIDYNYPDDNKNKNAYITATDFGQDKPYPSVSCSNSSIINSLKTGPMQLLPSQLSCDLPNKLTAENYYKTHYNSRSIPMDDYSVRGANYMDFTDTVAPKNINTRILSQNTKGLIPSATEYRNIPTGSNYVFYGTPALPMP